MQPRSWHRVIGKSLFNHLSRVAVEAGCPVEVADAVVAQVLGHACEMGFTAPVAAPRVSAGGTATLWPKGEQVLTTSGLLDFYERRGHKFFLLRMPQMLRGHRGPLAARLQESLALYEAQCDAEGVSALPDYADVGVFVGGERDERPSVSLAEHLMNERNGETD